MMSFENNTISLTFSTAGFSSRPSDDTSTAQEQTTRVFILFRFFRDLLTWLSSILHLRVELFNSLSKVTSIP